MPDRQQDPESALQATENSSNRPAETGVPFRLIADFVVETETAAEFLKKPDLTPEQRNLFLILLTDQEARNRVSRLAIVCDLSAYEHCKYFDGLFSGPHAEQILDRVLPCLTADLQKYWTRLRAEEYDYFASLIDEVFLQFNSSLKKVVIEDRISGEEIPLRLSEPDCDAEELSPDKWASTGHE
jgi:hypothetical protein